MYLSLFTLCSNYFHQKNIQVFFFHIFKSHLSNVSKNYVTIQICEPFLPSQYILYVAVCKLLRCLTQFCLMVLSFVFIYMCVHTYIYIYMYVCMYVWKINNVKATMRSQKSQRLLFLYAHHWKYPSWTLAC